MSTMGVIAAAVMMAIGRCGIGATLWIERRVDFHHVSAESRGQFGKNVIAPDAQRVCQELRRHVPVAQMPGDAGEMLMIGAANFQERLGRGDDLDQPSVFQQQRVAAAQLGRRGEVEQKRSPVLAGHGNAAAMAIVVIEHDAIGGLARPSRRYLDGNGAHERNPSFAFQNKK